MGGGRDAAGPVPSYRIYTRDGGNWIFTVLLHAFQPSDDDLTVTIRMQLGTKQQYEQ